MSIKPLFPVDNEGLQSDREFTDREYYLQVFEDMVEKAKIESNNHNVLVYYGVGGIGKTSLRKELAKQLLTIDPNAILDILDFETPNYRDPDTALFWLRKSLKQRFGIQFNRFDLAYAAYWQKTNPQTPLNRESFSFANEGDLISDIIATVENVPVINWGFKIGITIKRGHSLLKDWLIKSGDELLKKLVQYEPKEIILRLPGYWAADIKEYIKKQDKTLVLFIDTYESLWGNDHSESKYFSKDAWVRELVSHLPGVLWVIVGREKLRWAERYKEWEGALHQYVLGGLAEEDAEYFLNSCGIDDVSIRKVIIESSVGVPYYLDLAVDTYEEITRNEHRIPTVEDFAETPGEIHERFLRNLNQSDIETLKVLSVAQFWEEKLLIELVTEFHTGYPLTALSELLRFSFINPGEDKETWTMHLLMKDSLIDVLDKNLKQRVRDFLVEYYAGLVKQDQYSHKGLSIREFFDSDYISYEEHERRFDELFNLVDTGSGRPFQVLCEYLEEFDVDKNKLKQVLQYIINSKESTKYDYLENLCNSKNGRVIFEALQAIFMETDQELFRLGKLIGGLSLKKNHLSDIWNLDQIKKLNSLFKSDCDFHELLLVLISVSELINRAEEDTHNVRNESVNEQIQLLGDNIYGLLGKEDSRLTFAIIWALSSLRHLELWEPNKKHELLQTLFKEWSDSPNKHLQESAAWLISRLPIDQKDYALLEKPNKSFLKFTNNKLQDSELVSERIAALTMSYYWGMPWSKKESIPFLVETSMAHLHYCLN